jgi:hypothetical protein
VALLNPPSHVLGRTNAILSTTAVPYLVETFPGPLSIKWMAAGWAVWETSTGSYRVDPSRYLVLNHARGCCMPAYVIADGVPKSPA